MRFCRGAHDDNLRGANNNIIAVPMTPAIRRISLHSLARRAPAPWGRRDIPVQNRQDIPASPYIRDYRPVCNCAIRQCLTPNVVAFLMLCLLLVVAVLLLCIFLFIDERCCCALLLHFSCGCVVVANIIVVVVVLLLPIFLLLSDVRASVSTCECILYHMHPLPAWPSASLCT